MVHSGSSQIFFFGVFEFIGHMRVWGPCSSILSRTAIRRAIFNSDAANQGVPIIVFEFLSLLLLRKDIDQFLDFFSLRKIRHLRDRSAQKLGLLHIAQLAQ